MRFIDHIWAAGLRRGWDGAAANCGLDPQGRISSLPAAPQPWPSTAPTAEDWKEREEMQQVSGSTSLSERNTMDSFCFSSSHEFLSTLNAVIIVWYGFVLIPCYL